MRSEERRARSEAGAKGGRWKAESGKPTADSREPKLGQADGGGGAGFALSLFVLFARGRLTAASAGLPASDLVLAGLFVWAFDALGRQNAAESRLKRPK